MLYFQLFIKLINKLKEYNFYIIMDKQLFLKFIDDNIKEYKFLNGELKIGNLRNNVFDYKINNNIYNNFKKFIDSNSRYKKESFTQSIYKHYDMYMVTKNENSHTCFKLINPNYKYIKLFENKLALRYKNTSNLMIDQINFPALEKYDQEENQEIDRYTISFKNSQILIDFININKNVNSIIISFQIHENNYENSLKNLSYILSKFYKINFTLK